MALLSNDFKGNMFLFLSPNVTYIWSFLLALEQVLCVNDLIKVSKLSKTTTEFFSVTAQKMKKSLTENFIFCAVCIENEAGQ